MSPFYAFVIVLHMVTAHLAILFRLNQIGSQIWETFGSANHIIAPLRNHEIGSQVNKFFLGHGRCKSGKNRATQQISFTLHNTQDRTITLVILWSVHLLYSMWHACKVACPYSMIFNTSSHLQSAFSIIICANTYAILRHACLHCNTGTCVHLYDLKSFIWLEIMCKLTLCHQSLYDCH